MFEALTLTVLAGLAYDTNGRFVGLISPSSHCLLSFKEKSAFGAEFFCARTHSQGSCCRASCRLSLSPCSLPGWPLSRAPGDKCHRQRQPPSSFLMSRWITSLCSSRGADSSSEGAAENGRK